jgi:hypothetical protein
MTKIVCPDCGSSIDDNLTQCNFCGAVIAAAPPPVQQYAAPPVQQYAAVQPEYAQPGGYAYPPKKPMGLIIGIGAGVLVVALIIILIVVFSGGSGSIIGGTGGPAQLTFTFHNDTNFPVSEIYVVPCGAGERGNNVLGNRTLAVGEKMEIIVAYYPNRDYVFDIFVVDRMGNENSYCSVELQTLVSDFLFFINENGLISARWTNRN